MTKSRITEQQPSTSTTATDSPVWGQRNLKVGAKILDDLKTAKRNKRIADAAEKQAMAALKHARTEGLLDEFYDELSEEYIGPGIKITVASSTRYSEKGYSADTQAAMKHERDTGIAKPTQVETYRVTIDD